MNSDPLLQLRDIHGLDLLPWWYSAPGWPLLTLTLLILAAAIGYALARRRPQQTWPRQARQELNALRQRLRQEPSKVLLADFSELLRRIAMARYGRHECAGLHGEAWLEWLYHHDPQGFRWQEQGRILLDLAYAPPTTRIDAARLSPLLEAAQHWLYPHQGQNARGKT
jgi:hypothetical protein